MKLTTSVVLIVMLLLASSEAASQTRKRAGRPAGSSKSTPAPTPTPTPAAPRPQLKATLQIEAGLIFKSGDVKPVARTIFYLFDRHPGEILRDAGIRSNMRSASADPSDPEILLFNLALAIRTEVLTDSAAFVKTAMPALQPHIIQTVTTDFSGKAVFTPVDPGTYYLAGFAEVGRSSATWNLKVAVASGPSLVVLDNNNATDIQNYRY